MFREKEKNHIKYFESTKLDGLHHAFSTRGLDMKNPLDRDKFLIELDFMPKAIPELSDEADYVEIQKEKVFQHNIIIPNQEHTSNIAIVDNVWDVKKDFLATDGIIITVPNVPVMLCFADCVPVILYSKKNQVLAVLHAGWRGTASGITKKACKIMIDTMGIHPKDISVAIGACISECCFEVSDEVKEVLEYSLEGEYDDIYAGNKMDLKKINAYQVMEKGIMDIDVMEYCTSCSNDLFYSYRKDNQTLMRHGVVAQLKEDLDD
ncbi:MAG: peptidoglycan editing factor PgeF [bacterium]